MMVFSTVVGVGFYSGVAIAEIVLWCTLFVLYSTSFSKEVTRLAGAVGLSSVGLGVIVSLFLFILL